MVVLKEKFIWTPRSLGFQAHMGTGDGDLDLSFAAGLELKLLCKDKTDPG